jgi:alkylhydroperoxidase family enzyme
MTLNGPDSPRIDPAPEPLDPEIAEAIDRLLRGGPVPMLFRVLARDRRLFFKFFNAGLLDPGHLTVRQREIVIDRTTARCDARYEWGVHVAIFAGPAGLSDEQIRSLAGGGPADGCWGEEDRLLIELCDQLHESATIDDQLWPRLRARFSEEAITELLMLAGYYRTVSYIVNATALPPEPVASTVEIMPVPAAGRRA